MKIQARWIHYSLIPRALYLIIGLEARDFNVTNLCNQFETSKDKDALILDQSLPKYLSLHL